MNVLLSVKPKYAEEIVAGRKKYEFRKAIFRREDVARVYVYSSSPVRKIVASFEIKQILSGSPCKIWALCGTQAGISKREFFNYFEDSDVAFAIKISNLRNFPKPINPYALFDGFRPPQSFYYLQHDFIPARWGLADPNSFEQLTYQHPDTKNVNARGTI